MNEKTHTSKGTMAFKSYAMIAVVIAGAALSGCSRARPANSIASSGVSKSATLPQVIADSPRTGGTYIISQRCLDQHNVTPEQALKLIAAGKCTCAKRIIVHEEGSDDYEAVYIPAAGDTFHVEKPNVTLVVSRKCLSENGLTAQEAVQRIASDSPCLCAKRLYIAEEMTDDEYDLADLVPADTYRVTVK